MYQLSTTVQKKKSHDNFIGSKLLKNIWGKYTISKCHLKNNTSILKFSIMIYSKENPNVKTNASSTLKYSLLCHLLEQWFSTGMAQECLKYAITI